MEEKIGVQKNENENKPKKNKALFILKIIGNVIFYLIIIALFIFALMNIRGGKTSFPNIFGRGFLSVQSTSMERSADKKQPEEWNSYEIKEIKKGDLVLVKTFSGKAEDIKVGDVITWYDSSIGSTGALNTHRIVYINAENGYVIAQGDRVAQTSPFDKNDPLGVYNYTLEASGAIQNVSISSILGVTTGVWGGAGKVLDNMQKNWLWYFVLPIAVLLLIELFFVFKNIMDYRNEKKKLLEGDKTKEDLKAELEAEREKMKAELLAELKAQGVVVNNNAPEEKEPEPVPTEEVKEEPVEVSEESQEEVIETQVEPVEEKEPEVENKTEEVKEETIEENLKEETVVLVSNPQETEAQEVKVNQEDVSELISDIDAEKGQKEVEKALKVAEKTKAPKKTSTKKTTKEPVRKETEEKKTTGRKKAGEGAKKTTTRKKAGEAPKTKAKTAEPKTSTRAKAGENTGRAKAGSKKTK